MEYLRIYESASGGYIEIHSLHGKEELSHNLSACIILAEQGYTLQLLPAIPAADSAGRSKWLPDVFGNKNPDLRINGFLIGDIKTPDQADSIKKSTINRCIFSAAQQKVDVVVLNLVDKNYTLQDIKKGVIGALQPGRNKSIKQVIILTKSSNVILIYREFVFDEQIYNLLDVF